MKLPSEGVKLRVIEAGKMAVLSDTGKMAVLSDTRKMVVLSDRAVAAVQTVAEIANQC